MCQPHQHDVCSGSISAELDQLASSAEPCKHHGKEKDSGGLFRSIFGTMSKSSSVTPSGASASASPSLERQLFCTESSSSEVAPLVSSGSVNHADGQFRKSVDVVLLSPTVRTKSSTDMCAGERLMHRIAARLAQVSLSSVSRMCRGSSVAVCCL